MRKYKLVCFVFLAAFLFPARNVRSQIIVNSGKSGGSGPIIVGSGKSEPGGSSGPIAVDSGKSGASHVADTEGCALFGSAAAEMQPQVLLPAAVLRSDQYVALQNIISHIFRDFQVRAEVYFYNDQGSPNAFATPDVYDPNFPDGSVMFGAVL